PMNGSSGVSSTWAWKMVVVMAGSLELDPSAAGICLGSMVSLQNLTASLPAWLSGHSRLRQVFHANGPQLAGTVQPAVVRVNGQFHRLRCRSGEIRIIMRRNRHFTPRKFFAIRVRCRANSYGLRVEARMTSSGLILRCIVGLLSPASRWRSWATATSPMTREGNFTEVSTGEVYAE